MIPRQNVGQKRGRSFSSGGNLNALIRTRRSPDPSSAPRARRTPSASHPPGREAVRLLDLGVATTLSKPTGFHAMGITQR